MERTNLYEACGLNEEVTHYGFNPATSHHPLRFVEIPKGQDKQYRVFIGHDFLDGRVIEGERPENFADHTTFALVGPGIHLSYTWGAKSLVDDFNGRTFVPRHPELAKEAEIYAQLRQFTKWKVMLKAFHRSPWMVVEGTLGIEPKRYFDNVMSCLITKEQFDTMVEEVKRFQERNRFYQATGLWRPNCHRFAGKILKAGGVRVPFWWGILPWPAIDAFLLDRIAGKKSPRMWGKWLLQSSFVTARIQEEFTCQSRPLDTNLGFGKQPEVSSLALT